MKFLSLPPIWGMSGVQNFFGKGYPFHALMKKLFGKRFTFAGVLFVAKTTTFAPNVGNMPMQDDGVTPKDWRPACIIAGPWQWLSGVMLNAVGLSGPGTQALLERNEWQQSLKPFMISFMSIAKAPNEETGMKLRLAEFEGFIKLLRLSKFQARMILQINVTCPNVGAAAKSTSLFHKECAGYLALAAEHMPHLEIIFKVNVYTDIDVMVKLQSHRQFVGVCVSNTLPWAALTRWQQIRYFPTSFFTRKSPLHHLGGGGLSGKPLFAPVENWVRQARLAGFEKHINAGGGILCPDDVSRLKRADADSVSIGSVAALRPWRLRAIINRAYEVFGSTTY